MPPAHAGGALTVLSPELCAAEPAGETCTRLKESIPAADIGLPTAGATIELAELKQPTPLTLAELPFKPLPSFLAVVPAAPEYCKVVGAIAPVDPKAPPIRFQVNLPTQWNGSSVQFGGGGFNGTLITGLGLPPLTPADRPSPLARGFVTYGTDSGHQNAAGVPLQAFALNDEALTNFAYAAYKKVRDVAVVLMQRRYGRAPAKLYYVGFSEGGREGLTMAQRFPGDFDGILSGVPVINWVGLQAAGTRAGVAQFGGGWIGPDKVKLVNDAVIAACDQLDGLADGIISNYEGCKRVFDATKVACAPGVEAGCLSEAQLNAVKAMHAPFEFSFPLANGLRSYPGWGLGGEGAPGSGPVGGWVSWQTGTAAPTLPPGPTSSRAWLYGSGAVQYFFARDPSYDVTKFDPAQFADRHAGDFGADGFHGPRSLCLLGARRQAHHVRKYGRLCAEPLRGHRVLQVRRSQDGGDQRREFLAPLRHARRRPHGRRRAVERGLAGSADRWSENGKAPVSWYRCARSEAAVRAARRPTDVPLPGLSTLSRWRRDQS